MGVARETGDISMTDQDSVDKQERVWGSIATLCASFTEGEWKLPTDCPGWSVQDQVAHIVGTEAWLLGRAGSRSHPARRGPRQEVVFEIQGEAGQRLPGATPTSWSGLLPRAAQAVTKAS